MGFLFKSSLDKLSDAEVKRWCIETINLVTMLDYHRTILSDNICDFGFGRDSDGDVDVLIYTTADIVRISKIFATDYVCVPAEEDENYKMRVTLKIMNCSFHTYVYSESEAEELMNE